MFWGSILQCFRPALGYHLSLRPSFCLFWVAAWDKFDCILKVFDTEQRCLFAGVKASLICNVVLFSFDKDGFSHDSLPTCSQQSRSHLCCSLARWYQLILSTIFQQFQAHVSCSGRAGYLWCFWSQRTQNLAHIVFLLIPMRHCQIKITISQNIVDEWSKLVSLVFNLAQVRLRKLGTVYGINLRSPYIRSHVSFWWGLNEGSYAIIHVINFCYYNHMSHVTWNPVFGKKLVFAWCDPYVEYISCRTH